MQRAVTICRYVLGVFFAVFGANGFLHFIPEPPPPHGLAGQFHAALSGSQYFHVVYFLQFACGVLLLAGRFVPLALTVLGAILVNILLFHATMEQNGIIPGLIASVIWSVVFWGYRDNFRLLFVSDAKPRD